MWASSCTAPLSLGSGAGIAIYDASPAHLWNRLHAALYVREDIPSTAQVPDALDPPLWPNTQYLLAKPSHERLLGILADPSVSWKQDRFDWGVLTGYWKASASPR
jgi:hypothetical protein